MLYTYLDLKKQGNWNQQTFDNIYLPQYLKEQAMNPTALTTMANLLAGDTSNMGAFCYCGNESLCHRSILGGILQGNGKRVEGLQGDYSKYADQFAKTYQEIHHKPLNFSDYAQSRSTSYCIALTGHRPKAFKAVRGNVYDLSDPTYQKLYKELHDYAVEKLDEHGSITCISGMALGADTVWAMVATNLKQEYGNDRVHFEAHSPLATHAEKWTKESQNQYQYLLNHSDKVVYYGATYSPKLMMDRNIGMIDNCDELIAVYNGISGQHSGTQHAVNYAISQGKAVHYTNRDYFAVSAPMTTQSTPQSRVSDVSSFKPTYDSNFRMRDDLEMAASSQKIMTPTQSKSEIIPFYSGHKNGFEKFSNFAYTPFTQTSSTGEVFDFTCNEQFIMFSKAMLFGDKSTATKILSETQPLQIKKLGRQVKPFDQMKWEQSKDEIFKTGLRLKFEQNNDLKSLLLSHPNATFVEANPYDTTYGAGLAATDMRIQNPNQWCGQNKMGMYLKEIQQEFLEQDLTVDRQDQANLSPSHDDLDLDL